MSAIIKRTHSSEDLVSLQNYTLKEPQKEEEKNLRTTLLALGFSEQKMLQDGFVDITNKIIQIFHATYPEKTLSGTLAEQCKEISQYFQDLPSLIFYNTLFPIKKTETEITGEMQRQKYMHSLDLKKINIDFQKYCWIPVPSPGMKKETWNEERVKWHIQQGYPFYLRLNHKEDQIYGYHNDINAILPSRVNTNDTRTYNPWATRNALYHYRYSLLPRDIRFEQTTQNAITEIQKEKQICEAEAIFHFASERLKSKGKNLNISSAAKCISNEFLFLHGNDSTHVTPFKGMIGGTIDDRVFVKEMKEVISGFIQDTKILIIIDKYGRFIRNDLNRDQKREFLAVGGILQSEIVHEIHAANFEEYMNNLMKA